MTNFCSNYFNIINVNDANYTTHLWISLGIAGVFSFLLHTLSAALANIRLNILYLSIICLFFTSFAISILNYYCSVLFTSPYLNMFSYVILNFIYIFPTRIFLTVLLISLIALRTPLTISENDSLLKNRGILVAFSCVFIIETATGIAALIHS